MRHCEYARDENSGYVFFRGDLSDVAVSSIKRKLPASIIVDPHRPNAIRSSDHVVWANTDRASPSEIEDLAKLNQQLRVDLHYINGSETLWYLKTTGARRLRRCSPTIVLAALSAAQLDRYFRRLDRGAWASVVDIIKKGRLAILGGAVIHLPLVDQRPGGRKNDRDPRARF